MRTAKDMTQELTEAKNNGALYVTYGEVDLGTPVKIDNAIADISVMADEMIGEGTWYECDESGNVA
jgi:hypothetical protein